MALKLPDSAVPMGDFPVAKAVDIDFDDGENLQEKLDNGKLGGAGGVDKQDFRVFKSLEEFNEKKGTSLTVVNGIDNMKDIVNAMSNGEMLIITIVYVLDSDVYFGLDVSTGWKKAFTFIKANGLCDVECRTTAPSTLKRILNTDGVIGDWQEIATMDKVDELFQSVSDGKTLVANAITGKGVSTETTATFATMATNVGKITNYTASEKQALATAITNKGVSTSSNASFSTMATNIGKITNYTKSDKEALANAITGKGVSTETTATFATMATNISKISGGYKEETINKTFSTTGISVLTFTFSANVLAIKQIIAPSDSCSILLQSSTNIFDINGKELIVHVTGSGTWKVTALIQN